jgi:hypothetical protein
LATPPVLENLTRSSDGLDWPREPAPGVVVMITLRDIRRTSTGMHAFVAITTEGRVFGHDTFNIGRSEDRSRLARRAVTNFGVALEGAYPREAVAHDLDLLCLWVIREYEQSQFALERFDPEETAPSADFILEPYVIAEAGTILFGEQGSGKSYLCQAMAVCLSQGLNHLWEITEPAPVAYVNLERSRTSMMGRESRLRQALNITGGTGVDYLHARGLGLTAVVASVRKWSKVNPSGLVILDSISRTGLGDLVGNETGNTFINLMNSLGCAWLAIGHPPRGDKEHLYGSVMFDAGEDIGIQVLSELQGLTRGISLKMVKANDTAFAPTAYYALEFAEDNSGLTGIRPAKKSEFPELSSGGSQTRLQQVVGFLKDQADGTATAKDIAEALDMKTPNVHSVLQGPLFAALPREGKTRRYGMAAPENG